MTNDEHLPQGPYSVRRFVDKYEVYDKFGSEIKDIAIIQKLINIGYEHCAAPEPEQSIEHDISVHGVYIEKDGKRVDPKDFYKSAESDFEILRQIIEKHKDGTWDALNDTVNLAQSILSAGYRRVLPSALSIEHIIENAVPGMLLEERAVIAQAILAFLKKGK